MRPDMHLYNESTTRRSILRAQINWSRELTFSPRQINYILNRVPHARGVYCIYAKDRLFPYEPPQSTTRFWNPVVYIGSGWLDNRLCAHLREQRNDILSSYIGNFNLGYRFDRIFDDDEFQDWPRTVEAGLLACFKQTFAALPPANRREELLPAMDLDQFLLAESYNFRVLKRGG
jgi:hypothetical protein